MMTLNLRTDEELVVSLEDTRKSLNELAPYNGSAPGARYIAEYRDRLEKIEKEIIRRGGISDPELRHRANAAIRQGY